MNKKQLDRMLKLADIKKSPINEGRKNSNIELIKATADGNTYAIVRENRTYYIKKTETRPTITENDLDFIGGLQNKTKNSFKSFEDATFRLNLMINDINRSRSITESVNLVNFDYTLNESGEYELLQEKKFVLKQPKPKKIEEPTKDFDFGGGEGGDEGFDFGDEEGNTEDSGDEGFDFGDEDTEDSGDEDFDFGDEDTEDVPEEGGDNIKDIQRTTGKLGQQLRDTEDISSDMQKWVVKSVISALKLDIMDDSDKDDIINAIESGGNDGEFDVDSEEEEIDFMGDESKERGGEPELDKDVEYLLDDETPGGYLGEPYVSRMSDDDMETCLNDDCTEVDEGMSEWVGDDGDSGMGWETNESIDYMGEDDYSYGKTKNMDIDYMNSPAPAEPTIRPDTDTPTKPTKPTKPGKPKRRRTIGPKPGTKPGPKAKVPEFMSFNALFNNK